MTQATEPVTLLPVLADGGQSRTRRDRLEVLDALLAAPSFDPAFREDVVRLAADHPVYGWLCDVPECARPAHSGRFCASHTVQWAAARKSGVNRPEFTRTATPLQSQIQRDQKPCLVCPELPAWSSFGLCYLHSNRWHSTRTHLRGCGIEADFDGWLAEAKPIPGFGPCQVEGCHYLAEHPLRLCLRHLSHYKRDGRPGGAEVPANWSRWLAERGKPVTVAYSQRAVFQKWCREAGLSRRMDGSLSLFGLRPLVKAEIKWAAFQHTQVPVEGAWWLLLDIQHLADHCLRVRANSLADLDLGALKTGPRRIAGRMLEYLRLVYFSREDTKDAGFIEAAHFGVRMPHRSGHLDLTNVTQRWLRDLLWDQIAHRLLTEPPRSKHSLDTWRRGCSELSAFLEAQAPEHGHDPTLLTKQHMVDFVADQRHRGENRLRFLGIRAKGSRSDRFGTPAKATKDAVARVFNGARVVLRHAMETGVSERVGLERAFIIALPYGGATGGRRRPFPDDVARALANETNLRALETFDPEDRGMRDVWEALVFTGRRCGEVLKARLDCIARLGGLPMFWHDQTKVGNLDAAIRIPERLFTRIEQRQAKTVARFHERYGRPPTSDERRKIALFPGRAANRQFLKSVGYGWFNTGFRGWVDTLDIAHCVPHQARHTLATNLIKNGANLTHVKRYLGQVSEAMAEHYVHLANTDPRLEDALQAVWVAGPGAPDPGLTLSSGEPMTREQAEALLIDLTRKSTPAEGGFCTFQPVVDGNECPWNLDCHNCDKFVMTGADLVYWHRKREQWRTLAEGAPDNKTADYLHDLFEPTARAIEGLEKALEAVGLLDEALALDLRRPQDYFGRVWSTAFRADELRRHQEEGDAA
ncbi:tyrosine-type recombinase/integrase [Streptomyces antarcticus]|uniref:tyrosine-type recombinase/integrase n=1 Tax=Streptomyces antarcticus TaxID=2996458 RepID=UPI0022706070|nr:MULTISPECIES: site-specific integrase [unclassified Streptomyces]MCY0945673.1 site-specific integrase [Streptomyces sp. H34-AA3]MCZ4082726.1 site-specific integrase [Streptomyces sp. H34-S5]